MINVRTGKEEILEIYADDTSTKNMKIFSLVVSAFMIPCNCKTI